MAPMIQKPGPGGRVGSLGSGGAPLSIDLKTRKPPGVPSPVHPYNKVRPEPRLSLQTHDACTHGAERKLTDPCAQGEGWRVKKTASTSPTFQPINGGHNTFYGTRPVYSKVDEGLEAQRIIQLFSNTGSKAPASPVGLFDSVPQTSPHSPTHPLRNLVSSSVPLSRAVTAAPKTSYHNPLVAPADTFRCKFAREVHNEASALRESARVRAHVRALC